MDDIINSNESVKEAIVEGISTSADSLKIAKEKAVIKDKINAKGPHRTMRTDCAFKIVLSEEVITELDEFSLRDQYRSRQIAYNSARTSSI